MQLIRIPPDHSISLKDFDPVFTQGRKKSTSPERLGKLQQRLAEHQELLYATKTHALLVVLQAMDALGKDSAIKKVFREVNPVGLRIANFKKPSEEELARDFLWRVHQQIPPKGYIGVFNRSHYEDVLIVKVHGWVGPEVIEQRYEQINQFEKMLVANNIRILKFYLHASLEEQTRQLRERLEDPTKHWKFNAGDLAERKLWNQYMAAYETAISRTSTVWAPWYVVPAIKRWFRNEIICESIIEELESLELKWPPLPKECRNLKL